MSLDNRPIQPSRPVKRSLARMSISGQNKRVCSAQTLSRGRSGIFPSSSWSCVQHAGAQTSTTKETLFFFSPPSLFAVSVRLAPAQIPLSHRGRICPFPLVVRLVECTVKPPQRSCAAANVPHCKCAFFPNPSPPPYLVHTLTARTLSWGLSE
jgi:hypothetical protein